MRNVMLGCLIALALVVNAEAAPPPAPAITELRGAEWSALRVAISPDGKRALSGEHNDGLIRLWDLSEGKLIRSLKADGGREVVCLAFSPDGTRALSSDKGNGVILWDLEKGSVLRRLPHRGTVWSIAFSKDGKRALTGSGTVQEESVPTASSVKLYIIDAFVREWDLDAGKTNFELADNGPVYSVAYSPDEKMALSGSGGVSGTCLLRDLKTGNTVRHFKSDRMFRSSSRVAFGAKGSRVIAAPEGTVLVFETGTGRTVSKFEGHWGAVIALEVLPDERQVMSASIDGSFALWDMETGKAVRIVGREPGGGGKNCAAFFPDQRFVLWSAENDKVLHVTALPVPQQK